MSFMNPRLSSTHSMTDLFGTYRAMTGYADSNGKCPWVVRNQRTHEDVEVFGFGPDARSNAIARAAELNEE